jgi:hypothetical protein
MPGRADVRAGQERGVLNDLIEVSRQVGYYYIVLSTYRGSKLGAC